MRNLLTRNYFGAALLGASVALGGTLVSSPVSAQAVIKQPTAHPSYKFDAEPHLIISDGYYYGDDGVGIGFRGTVIVVDPGWVKTINNTVGIGFGLDWIAFGDNHCHGPQRNDCHSHGDTIILPVVMQWNFWVHQKWAVFGEPGFSLVFHDRDHVNDGDELDIDPLIIYVGGRYHFSDNAALTLRLGYPTSLSVGVSFLL